VAVQPNTDGRLSRATDLPVNSATPGTGWTVAFWMRLANTPAAGEVVFNIDNGAGGFVQLNFASSAALRIETELGVQTTVATLTVGTWYFMALRSLSLTTVQGLFRTESALGALGSTAVCTMLSATWANMDLLSNAGASVAADVELAFFRMYSGTGGVFSSAQLWEESWRQIPKTPGAPLDSYLPLHTGSGADEGGLARDWTVTGTLATLTTQPRIVRGGNVPARRSTASNIITLGAPLAVAADIQSPAALSTQPVTIGAPVGVAAAVQAPAVGQFVTLGGPVTVAEAVQSPAALSIQPVTLGGPVAVAATVQAPNVGGIALPDVAAVTETPQQPAMTSVQGVTMAAAVQAALTVQQPAVTQSVIQVSGPAPIVLAIPLPSGDDPYPHDFRRRSRGDFRRAKMS
jgi:hypothetical protein